MPLRSSRHTRQSPRERCRAVDDGDGGDGDGDDDAADGDDDDDDAADVAADVANCIRYLCPADARRFCAFVHGNCCCVSIQSPVLRP
jgi:hypothetical protein